MQNNAYIVFLMESNKKFIDMQYNCTFCVSKTSKIKEENVWIYNIWMLKIPSNLN